MKECPCCRQNWPDMFRFCKVDGYALIALSQEGHFVGTTFDNKYEIQQKIGQGGMGSVYKARHIFMDSLVAIKLINASISTDFNALERLRQEAWAAAQIRHPNVVSVTDFGVTNNDSTAYIVMEYLEGISLRERLITKTRLECEEIFFVTHQVCCALQAAHKKGIIHRDLKPDNIWLEGPNNPVPHVKVLDFGLAKLKEIDRAAALTEKGTILGTPAYMSPEQWRGEELDIGSDIYSLGVIVYEMLTGQLPFTASNSMGFSYKHLYERPKRPSEVMTQSILFKQIIPSEIEELVLRALEKKRELRQESALQFSQDFENALVTSGLNLRTYWKEKNRDSDWPFDPVGTAGQL